MATSSNRLLAPASAAAVPEVPRRWSLLFGSKVPTPTPYLVRTLGGVDARRQGGGPVMWQWHNYSGWWFLVMPVVMVAFWGLVAWVVVTLVRSDRATPPRRSDAETILAER